MNPPLWLLEPRLLLNPPLGLLELRLLLNPLLWLELLELLRPKLREGVEEEEPMLLLDEPYRLVEEEVPRSILSLLELEEEPKLVEGPSLRRLKVVPSLRLLELLRLLPNPDLLLTSGVWRTVMSRVLLPIRS